MRSTGRENAVYTKQFERLIKPIKPISIQKKKKKTGKFDVFLSSLSEV